MILPPRVLVAAILMVYFIPIIPQSGIGVVWFGLVSNAAAMIFLLACMLVPNTVLPFICMNLPDVINQLRHFRI